MTLIRRNVAANLAANVWFALVSIAFVPFYIHFMGLEAYGLVGFYATLQGVFAILDMGLTATLSRELARLSAVEGARQQMRDLVRTLEVIYWAIAAAIMLVLAAAAPWISDSWLNTSGLSQQSVRTSLTLMGVVIALRMPYGFYAGGLLGLQRQVLLNAVKVSVETAKSVGAVLVLWCVEPTAIAFFSWQATVSAVGVLVMAGLLWNTIPGGRIAVRFAMLGGIWKFAAGMSGISILATILVQSDKLVLSKMLSLESFGYYTVASMVSMGLYVMITPIFSAIYPRLTQLVANADESELTLLYHKSCGFMTVLVMPAAQVICFFSEDVLRIWTRDPAIASHTAPILSLLIIGTAMNGMMNIPYATQIAYGWTRLTIHMNLTAIAILIPALIVMVTAYGAVGAAIIWVALNTGYLVFGLPLMHKRILKKELRHWFVTDFGVPAGASLIVAASCRFAMPDASSEIFLVFWIALTYIFSWFAAISTIPEFRSIASAWLNKFVKQSA